jgi:hypothetical protein
MNEVVNIVSAGEQELSAQEMLEKVQTLTQMMREHQQAVVRLGRQRRRVIRQMREQKIPYKSIAFACGVTDQAVFADLRKHPDE